MLNGRRTFISTLNRRQLYAKLMTPTASNSLGTTAATGYIRSFLLSATSKHYSLRERRHNYQLPHRTSISLQKHKLCYKYVIKSLSSLTILL